MKYALPFIFLLLTSPLCSMEEEELMEEDEVKTQRKQPERRPPHQKRPQKSSQLFGQETMRAKSKKKQLEAEEEQALQQLADARKEKKKLEKVEEVREMKKRRQTIRLEFEGRKYTQKPFYQKKPEKTESEPDLRRKKKSFKNLFGWFSKKDEEEGITQEKEEETRVYNKGHRRNGSHSLGDLELLKESLKEELAKQVREEFEKRLSINLGSKESSSQPEEELFLNTLPISIEQPSSNSSNDLKWYTSEYHSL